MAIPPRLSRSLHNSPSTIVPARRRNNTPKAEGQFSETAVDVVGCEASPSLDESAVSSSMSSPLPLPCNSNSVLRESERCFLKRDYKRSLLLVHSFFEEENRRWTTDDVSPNRRATTEKATAATETTTTTTTIPDSSLLSIEAESEQVSSSARNNTKTNTTTTIRLVPPIRIPHSATAKCYSFVADLTPSSASTTTTTPADQLAAIGLQSWYELFQMEQQLVSSKLQASSSPASTDRWSTLVEMLEYYAAADPDKISSTASIAPPSLSVELLTGLWISFWESNGYEFEALLWTVQYLHVSFHSICQSTKTSDHKRLLEELWLRCVCQQIPRLFNNNNTQQQQLAGKLLNICTEQRKEAFKAQDFEGIWKEMKHLRENQDRESSNGDLVTAALIQSLDSYLEDHADENTDDSCDDRIDSAVADSSSVGSNARRACVSRKTMVQARRWLSQQQKKQRKKTRGDRELGHNNDYSSPKRPSNHSPQHSNTKVPDTGLHSPTTSYLMYNGGILESFWSKIGDRLPTRALTAVAKVFQGAFLRAFPGSDRYGTMLRNRVLRLVSFSFVAAAAPTTELSKEERLRVLRQHLQQALLSAVLFWAGWRGRKLLWNCGKAVVWASLAPLREILEALGQNE